MLKFINGGPGRTHHLPSSTIKRLVHNGIPLNCEAILANVRKGFRVNYTTTTLQLHNRKLGVGLRVTMAQNGCGACLHCGHSGLQPSRTRHVVRRTSGIRVVRKGAPLRTRELHSHRIISGDSLLFCCSARLHSSFQGGFVSCCLRRRRPQGGIYSLSSGDNQTFITGRTDLHCVQRQSLIIVTGDVSGVCLRS